MSLHDLKWSKPEKAAARRAYEAAYRRECASIQATLKEMLVATNFLAGLCTSKILLDSWEPIPIVLSPLVTFSGDAWSDEASPLLYSCG